MITRDITGSVSRPDGTPWTFAVVRFTLVPGSFTADEQIPQKAVTVETGEDGDFTVELWANEEGDLASLYLCTLPGGESFNFVLPADPITPTTLSELRGAYAGPTSPQSSYADTHLGSYPLAVTVPVANDGYRFDGTSFVPVPMYSRTEADAAFLSAGEGDTAYLSQAEGDARYALLAQTNVMSTQFGAVGDGVADDTVALRLAIAAAGVKGTVLFPPGKTFLVCGRLVPLSGQTWIGYGATIKRCNAVATSTATAIASGVGTRTFTVASATGLRVGMSIQFYTGVYPAGDTGTHDITTIVGNLVTTSGDFTYVTAYPAGANIVSSFPVIMDIGGADVNSRIKILGLEIDGNKANNTTYLDWRTQASIVLYAAEGVVRDCYLHDNQSDGIILGGTGSTAESNRIINSNANGVHLSGATSPRVLNNYIKNSALNLATGHSEGAVTISDLIYDAVISGNTFDTCVYGIGSIDAPSGGNADITITGNIFRNASAGAIAFSAAEGALYNYIIANNRFYSCASLSVVNQTSPATYTTGPARIIIANNLFDDTRLSFSRCNRVQVVGNDFAKTTSVPSNELLYLENCQGVIVGNNRFHAHSYAIRLLNTASAGLTYTRNILIHGNHFLNQTLRGIAGETGTTDAFENVAIHGNLFENLVATSNNNYAAIAIGGKADVKNNSLTVRRGHGIIMQANTGLAELQATGGVVMGNTVRVTGGGYTIRLPVASTGIVVVNNFVTAAVSDAGTSNTLANNYTIT